MLLTLCTEMTPVLLHFQNYWYSGTESSDWCHCNTAYDKNGEATNCDMQCDGDTSQMCGGAWALSVRMTTACKLHIENNMM